MDFYNRTAVYNSANTTYISKCDIHNNFDSLELLQNFIIDTLRRWTIIHKHELETLAWEEFNQETEVYNDPFIKNYRLPTEEVLLCIKIKAKGPNPGSDLNSLYSLTMYAMGRYRRNGSSVDFFEQVMEALEIQLTNIELIFNQMSDCFDHKLLTCPPDMSYFKTRSSHVEEENNEENL
jgi:hypothetical protein